MGIGTILLLMLIPYRGFALCPDYDTVIDDSVSAHHNVFSSNWDTVSIFAYPQVQLVDFPSIIELRLIDSLGDFCCPVVGRVTSQYGPRGRYRNHNGIDIPLAVGVPIYSAFSGRVRYARMNHGGFGMLVIVRHTNGLESYSAHLSQIDVKAGEYVHAGQQIGLAGNTGRSSGPHLHYELRYQDHAFDPERVINFADGTLCYMSLALDKGHFNIMSKASNELDEQEVYDLNTEKILSSVDEHIMENDFEEPIYHTVKNGDTIVGLSVKYGVKVSQICELSEIRMDQTLKLGRKLRIR